MATTIRLAELVALKRARVLTKFIKNSGGIERVYNLCGTFDWDTSPEGGRFWKVKLNEIKHSLDKSYPNTFMTIKQFQALHLSL